MVKLANIFVVLMLMLSISLIAQDMEPEAAQAYNNGNELMKAGDFNGAIKSYETALKSSKDYRIYYQKAVALKRANKVTESVDILKTCIQQNPDFDLAYNALAGSYFTLRDHDAAIEMFQKGIEITKNATLKKRMQENIARSYTSKATEQLTQGNSNAAIENLIKATQNHNFDAAFLTLARAYSDNTEWDKAIEAADNAAKYRSSISRGAPAFYKGIAHRGKGEISKALEMFNEAKADAQYRKLAEYEISVTK